ncbi:hypothetical protein O7627_04775 [Solwaraspora sp. WMMD1047]|uniref:hypothetical protein n=1 Tax=Solwaraspora sp. WMMD1047 TaxID=3016102 RepID=UPI0024164686|nr:hypothetical protein [Solwaraspora sp. WMMD1047]MDG4828619.1 hypothetical protein [Solwaraspora sp. WMMD1047]
MTSTARVEPDAEPADRASGPTDAPDQPADTVRETTGPAAGPGSRVPRWRRWVTTLRPYRVDFGTCLLFVLLAGWLTQGLWPDPGARVLALNPADQTLYEWFLAMDARLLYGDFSLLSDRLNAPDGVNLMANTTVIALGFLFAPVTLLAGAPVTFALLAAANLAGTAIAWYWLYRHTLGLGRLAAGLAGGFCGFAPGMISQSNAHLHMTAQWLVPVIIWLVVRLIRAADPAARPDGRRDPRGIARNGALIALTVTVQVFVGEEVLFLSAVALVVLAVVYAVARPRFTWRVLPGFLAGMLLAVGLALVALAYPLWFQFAGPQSVPNGMFSPHYFSADLASWPAFSPLSVAGSAAGEALTTGPAEYNTFLGWPLIIVTLVCAAALIRRPLVIGCVAAGLAMAALSLGPVIVVNREPTELTGPYSMLLEVPVVDGALPMRFALALIPVIATVLALAVDRAVRDVRRPVQLLVPAACVAAFLPIFPEPLPTTDRPPLPEFITAGHWRDCVRPGGVLVPVPLPTPQEPWPMRWATGADAGFSLPEGFFIGPYAAGGRASMGTYKRPTSKLLADVAKTGRLPAITDRTRQAAQRDVAFWDASCVALGDDAPNAAALLDALEQLFGPATRSADVWTWRVGRP